MRLLALVFLFLISTLTYSADSIVLPTINTLNNVQELNRLDARLLYTLRVRYWEDGQKIYVFHLPKDSSLHISFVKTVLDMSPTVFNKQIAYITGLGYSSNIFEVKTEAEMLRKVSTTAGSIGYISDEYLVLNGGSGVKVIRITD